MSYTLNHGEHLAQKAAELGARVVIPEPDELQIDLDSPMDQYVMEALLPILVENGFPIQVVKITKSMGSGKHAYLRADRPLDTVERLLLQACLGSDRKRELLGYLHHMKPDGEKTYPTCFFEKKLTTQEAGF